MADSCGARRLPSCLPACLRRVYPPGMHVLVLGFVTNMPELMCASGACV